MDFDGASPAPAPIAPSMSMARPSRVGAAPAPKGRSEAEEARQRLARRRVDVALPKGERQSGGFASSVGWGLALVGGPAPDNLISGRRACADPTSVTAPPVSTSPSRPSPSGAGVQGGGDLPKRLRPGGLSLTDSWRTDGGVRVSEVPFLGKRI